MRLRVLGSGTALPDPLRGATGFALTVGGRTWWVDAGPGSVQRSGMAGIDPLALSGVWLTHLHPDHSAEIVPLLFAYRIARRTAPFHLYGGKGTAPWMESLRQAWGKSVDVPKMPFHIIELPLVGVGEQVDGDLRVISAPAAHTASAVHLRFEADGASITFSGDTGPSRYLEELAQGTDLLVTECAGSDEQRIDKHLWPSAIIQLVKKARPKQVWLTHIYPDVDPTRIPKQIEDATGVPVHHAHDLDAWDSARQVIRS